MKNLMSIENKIYKIKKYKLKKKPFYTIFIYNEYIFYLI